MTGIVFLQDVPYVGSSSISKQHSLISESTQAAMDRVMEQLNSQELFNIIESTDDNPYNFTNLHSNTEGINNEGNLDDVVQETPHDTLLESQKIRGEEGMDIDQSITILETQRTKQGFQVGERVGLLHHIHDTTVASAIIFSTAADAQLHNRQQPEDYYKVSIQEAIVDDAPLMITNTDDDPPQLLVRDAIGTMTAWKWDCIQRMLEI